MPRLPRFALGGYVYHVLNRANGRYTLFRNVREYQEFEALMEDANKDFQVRILAYALMPNHWHMLLHPHGDKDMPDFMRWLTTKHAGRFRYVTDTVGEGHVYQSRYKSFVVDTDTYFLTALKYIERNPVRANLARSPEEWRWGSAHRRIHGSKKERQLLAEPPSLLPHGYRRWINEEEHDGDLADIRRSVAQSTPFGDENFKNKFIIQN